MTMNARTLPRSPRRAFALWLGLCFTLMTGLRAAPAQAQEIIVKLGTSAPVGSPWHILMKEAAEKWTTVSGGRVKMRIFAGGTMGNEGDMVKKMRIGQLQAAGLSTIGLHEITTEPLALDLPFVIQSPEERDYVLSKMGKQLEDALEKKGFVVLNWSEIGFVRFFTTEARPTVDKMRDAKVFSWDGDPDSTNAWKAAGFHPVVLSATDILPSLQTGMINALAYPPAVVLTTRIHDKAKFMLDMVLSSLTGALIIDKRTWDKIPADMRPKLMEIARELGRKTVADSRKMESEALTKMKAQGLQVVAATNPAEWRKAWSAANDSVRNKVVPGAVLDEISRLAAEYRSSHLKAR